MTYAAFSFARMANEQIIQTIPAEKHDIIPAGFKNSVHWNYGHILVIADHVLGHAPTFEKTIPKGYYHPFAKRSSPLQWTDKVPSIETLQEAAAKQKQAAEKLVEESGGADKAVPFTLHGHSFQTVDELFSFVAFHEGMHYRTLLHYSNVFSN
ncbi:DinB family protein [Alkalihalobacillus clausii]|uniref:DinB family protein n=1 Tax=Shouchella clausii TaxID=79880 RepID=UPI001C23B1C6|nr:DinB family protein [Shouchella clausii]MBU8597587.1 DinB family protein [Shouchella clausii]